MGLQYLSYQQIDKNKWDACIETAHNGLIYARTFYLDNMAKQWDALVLHDYEAVMPLPWNKKYSISYVYTPPFIQQLGIFSAHPIDETTQALFVSAVRQRFRFAELFINFNKGAEHLNFILPLTAAYTFIQHGYKTDLKKNLQHATKFLLNYQESFDIEGTIKLYQHYYGSRIQHIKQRDYQQFNKVCTAALNENCLLIRKVLDDKKQTLAVALLFKDKKRLYNVMSVVTNAGRQCEANHYLFDTLVKEFSRQQLVLDFEGSSIEGIANFYKKFGAVKEPYFHFRYNNLPWPLKYFK